MVVDHVRWRHSFAGELLDFLAQMRQSGDVCSHLVEDYTGDVLKFMSLLLLIFSLHGFENGSIA